MIKSIPTLSGKDADKFGEKMMNNSQREVVSNSKNCFVSQNIPVDTQTQRDRTIFQQGEASGRMKERKEFAEFLEVYKDKWLKLFNIADFEWLKEPIETKIKELEENHA